MVLRILISIVNVLFFFILCSVFLPGKANAQTLSRPVLRVCIVIANGGGYIVDGSEQPNTKFTMNWFDPNPSPAREGDATDVPPSMSFTTPLSLNTTLPNFPKGFGGGSNARCQSTTDFRIRNSGDGGAYYYRPLRIEPGTWNAIQYHDGYTEAAEYENLDRYYNNLFDSDRTNDQGNQRNQNADGHVCIGRCMPRDFTTRTVVYFAQYGGNSPLRDYDPICTNSTCSQKDIGEFDTLERFRRNSNLNIRDERWVRLSIRGRDAVDNILVQERINSQYFSIKQLSADLSNRTFIIKKPASTGEEDVTDSECPNLSCVISSYPDATIPNLRGFDVRLPGITSTDYRYIYFKVESRLLPGESIQVNDVDASDGERSRIQYTSSTGTATVNLNSTTASITATWNFFQVQGGNVYSRSGRNPSLISLLPTGLFFDTVGATIPLAAGPMNFGRGKINSKTKPMSVTGYQHASTDLSYNGLRALYEQSIKDFNMNQPINLSLTSSGYYQPSIPNGTLIVDQNWDNEIVGKSIVIFVPGNMIVKDSSNLRVRKDGRSAITFIVKGYVGFEGGETTFHGNIITDGRLHTACSYNPGSGECSDVNSNITLSIEGSTYAAGGYRLYRLTDSDSPGEVFTYRPDMAIAAMPMLGRKQVLWKEVLE